MNTKSRKPKSTMQKYAIALGGVWIVFSVFCALIYGLILGPQSARLNSLQTAMQTASEDYQMAQRARRPETKQRILDRLEKTRQTLNQFIISAEASLRLTTQISQLAAQHNLREFSVKTREVSPTLEPDGNNNITEAWLELTFSAPFSHCAAYINELERNEPVIFVESAEISRPMTATEEPSARILVSYLIDTEQAAPTQVSSSNQPLTAAAE